MTDGQTDFHGSKCNRLKNSLSLIGSINVNKCYYLSNYQQKDKLAENRMQCKNATGFSHKDGSITFLILKGLKFCDIFAGSIEILAMNLETKGTFHLIERVVRPI